MVSSNAKHRAAPREAEPRGAGLLPLLYLLGGLIALSGIVAGGAGLMGAFDL